MLTGRDVGCIQIFWFDVGDFLARSFDIEIAVSGPFQTCFTSAADLHLFSEAKS